eukprot:scaffold3917_cov377-Prasinococcus_capsulatus_cf.AAC.11
MNISTSISKVNKRLPSAPPAFHELQSEVRGTAHAIGSSMSDRPARSLSVDWRLTLPRTVVLTGPFRLDNHPKLKEDFRRWVVHFGATTAWIAATAAPAIVASAVGSTVPVIVTCWLPRAVANTDHSRSVHGGLLTIVASCLMLGLFLSELALFRTVRTHTVGQQRDGAPRHGRC